MLQSRLSWLVVAAICSTSLGQPIPIPNGNFEAVAVSPCGFRGFFVGTDSWTNTIVNLPVGSGGIWTPGTCWDMLPPEGAQVGYSNGGTSANTLPTFAAPSTKYTLSVLVGTRSHPCCAPQTVTLQLWAGDQQFGLLTYSPGQAPPAGTWGLRTLVATTPAVLPASPRLQIRFSVSGAQADFDDFQLFGAAGACPGDLNGDDLVDDSDFVLFLAAYNILDCADPSMPAGCPADLNSDGVVDDSDFVLFVAAYNELVCP